VLHCTFLTPDYLCICCTLCHQLYFCYVYMNACLVRCTPPLAILQCLGNSSGHTRKRDHAHFFFGIGPCPTPSQPRRGVINKIAELRFDYKPATFATPSHPSGLSFCFRTKARGDKGPCTLASCNVLLFI
jgi:hypothetical protein